MAQSAEQQRRWERRAPTHPVRVSAETEALATAAGEALNLSDGGACLALQTSDLSVGDEVILWLSFERSGQPRAGHRPHRLGGRQLGPAPLRRPVDAPGPAAVLDRLAGEGLAASPAYRAQSMSRITPTWNVRGASQTWNCPWTGVPSALARKMSLSSKRLSTCA